MTYVHRCMIVPAAKQALAKELVVRLAGPPAEEMFTTGLSASGEEPFTHYISSGLIEEQFAAVLSDPGIMAAVCMDAGREITLLECADLLSACDISEDDPFVALERITLRLLTYEQRLALKAERDKAAAEALKNALQT